MQTEALSLGHVVDSSMQQLVKLGFLACIIAWSLTLTSNSLWLNLPFAAAVILAAVWFTTHFSIEPSSAQPKKRRGLTIDKEEAGASRKPPATPFDVPSEGLPGGRGKAKTWREEVKSAVVENAWETLCGSIIQEFIYDMWFGALSPDKEFPKEIRRVMNTAFGELAGRARRTDLKGMLLRDVSELVMDQIELYRHTKESILQGLDAEAWGNLSGEARDRALLNELRAEKNLHPALYPPEESSAVLGHYKVLHTVCDGVVAFLMERNDHAKLMMRSVARELLVTCVFRALLGFMTPYYISKLLLSVLQKNVERKPLDVEEVAAAAEARAPTAHDAAKGWEFAERARQSIQQEEGVGAKKLSSQLPRKHPKEHAQLDKPQQSSLIMEKRGDSQHIALKRVMSENSLGARSRSESWEDIHPTTSARVLRANSNRTSPSRPSLEPASKSAEPASSSSPDAGNIMGIAPQAAQWRSKGDFIGSPRARVVAAELNTEGSKDVVIYKIRVADGTGEWTVSRRFRNFEALQRTLKQIPSYRIKLPAKRVFTHSQTVEFVEERRQQLDQYLQQILADPNLTGRMEIWEFLSAWSELYELECDDSILGTINASLKDASVNARRAVGSIVDDVSAKRQHANASLSKLTNTFAVNGPEVDFTPQSMPRAAPRVPPSHSAEAPVNRTQQGVLPKFPSPSQGMQKLFNPDFQNLVPSFFAKPKKSGPDEKDVGVAAAADGFRDTAPRTEEFRGHLLHYTTRSAEPSVTVTEPNTQVQDANDRAEKPEASGERSFATPLASPQDRSSDADPAINDPLGASRQPSGNALHTPPTTEVDKDVLQAAQRLQSAESLPQKSADSGHIKLVGAPAVTSSPLAAAEKLQAVPPAAIPSSLAQAVESDQDIDLAAVLEESAGISAPLYDVIDVLFELQFRGYFRRQVYGVARQMLSLVAGGAIDEYILSQLRALRQEHQLARLIHSLQIALWPGGTWFQRLPERQPPPSAAPQPRFVMTPENFLAPPASEPLDSEEIKEAVRELLMSSAPPALIRIIGRTAYQAGMQDLYEMVQSRTFIQQLGYGLLKIVLVNLFPELRPLFRNIERAPLDSSGKR